MYETKEALTKFLPKQYEKAIQYVEVNGRTKIVVRGQISEYIPNPTFDVVAAPGAQEDYYRNGNPNTVAEPSGAVATAGFLFRADQLPKTNLNVAIISGGDGFTVR